MKRWLIPLLFALLGCQTTKPDLEPPPEPEHFALPPESDTRYGTLATYPKETREQDALRKVPTPNIMPTRGPRGIGPGGY
jgi:hypothetical protein